MRRSFQMMLVACLSLTLSACFTSTVPLISTADNEVLIASGFYKVFEFNENDGEAELSWSGQLDVTDGVITSEVDEYPFENMRVRSLTADIFVGQTAQDEDEDEFLYIIIFAYENGTLGFHLPDCGLLSEETVAELELEVGEYNTCEVTDWDTLSEALMIYIREQGDDMIISSAMYRQN
jgi:hypothetical protein